MHIVQLMREKNDAIEVLQFEIRTENTLESRRILIDEVPPHISFKVPDLVVFFHKSLNHVAICSRFTHLTIEEHQ
jgi:hypothetical protein